MYSLITHVTHITIVELPADSFTWIFFLEQALSLYVSKMDLLDDFQYCPICV